MLVFQEVYRIPKKSQVEKESHGEEMNIIIPALVILVLWSSLTTSCQQIAAEIETPT